MDTDQASWVNAIEQDGLIWPNHVSDLMGWKSFVIKLYGFSAIPHTVLVGKDGNIIDVGLRGDALEKKLAEILITPSTKGILTGLAGVPEADDVNISRADIERHSAAFGFEQVSDIDLYEKLLKQGFGVISDALAKLDQIFVDTKFEFGYVKDANGQSKLIYMDEVGTPDSSRIWDGPSWREGKIVEQSKEGFRQWLLNNFPDPDILLNKDRMPERAALARDNALPTEVMMDISRTYLGIAEKVIGRKIELSADPKAEIIDVLDKQYDLIQK